MKEFNVKLLNIFIILTISGFLIVSILPKLFSLVDTSFSIQYRVIVLFLAILMIITSMFSKHTHLIVLSPYLLFFAFWFIYAIRILYDLLYKEIFLFPGKSVSEYLQYAFGVVLIPSLAILVNNHKKINYDLVLKWIYRVLYVSLILAIFTRDKEVSGRNSGELEIGILLFGQYGTSLCLLSIFLFFKNKVNGISLFYIIGFILGFISIFISASRSPLLSLLIVTVVFFGFRFGKFKLIFVTFFFSILLYFYFMDVMLFLNSYFNSIFLDRLLYAIEIGGDESRAELLEVGFKGFLNNPFFGSSMLIQESGYIGTYPHNLVVEAFMATGIFGGILFLLYIIRCIKFSLNIIRNNFEISWISLLFLQFFIFGMFSWNLFTSNLFWISSVMLLGASIKINRINKAKFGCKK